MRRFSKRQTKKRKPKARKKSRVKNRAANFAGALVLEVFGMVLLLTLFFTFRESPAEYNPRIDGEDNQSKVEVVQYDKEFETYVAGLFERPNR